MRNQLALVTVLAAIAIAGCGGESSAGESNGNAAKTTTAEVPAPTREKPQVSVPNRPAPKVLVKNDLIDGTGATAKDGDEVSIQYVGVLYKGGGTFASTSWEAGAPYVFTLGDPGVTEGWNRGIAGMRVGGRRELIIPPRLGFGNQQAGAAPPNSTLVYVIDLIAVG